MPLSALAAANLGKMCMTVELPYRSQQNTIADLMGHPALLQLMTHDKELGRARSPLSLLIANPAAYLDTSA